VIQNLTDQRGTSRQAAKPTCTCVCDDELALVCVCVCVCVCVFSAKSRKDTKIIGDLGGGGGSLSSFA